MDNEGKIAIIGMAGRFPGAKNLNEFWCNLENSIESLSILTDDELLESGIPEDRLQDENFVKKGFVLDDIEKFDAAFFNCSPAEARLMDPQIRFFLECAWQALEDSGLDPERYEGNVGVFSGMGMNSYIFNFARNRSGIKSGEAFQTKILNDKDFLSTWTSYKLNLTGPSMSIQTACSTSLVAVHIATQSLLNGECDIAIAGAVSIGVPQKLGHYYYKGGIESIDGHCRAFDANGRGTMNSSGVGVVVLQRLDDAVEEKNCIDAVLLGSAINNDGTLKLSYTAPSIDGQSKVIAEALAVAGVPADSISYVEAHGTGTPLGDPTEIAALTDVYRDYTEDSGFCGIGSVKTNIGHLDTAAGIAGLIKTVLAMKHKKLPASLHYESPNPEIDFETSPFYVNAQLRDWRQEEGPLRAGVSSFGIGGTNAHVILEEYVDQSVPEGTDLLEALILSARTETALGKMAGNLSAFLRDNPGISLKDVAHTLQTGRKEFEWRRVVVCNSIDNAIRGLEKKAEHGMQGIHNRGEAGVVFMFPGQGSQYPDMTRDLYTRYDVFREELDRCFDIVEKSVGLDLKEFLFVEGVAESDCLAVLNQTQYTQPLIFSVEYALARLLMAWGFTPDAMIGHSIGEYVAACIAGVLTLESALTLVVKRGLLVSQLPVGKMLAVRKSPAYLQSALSGKYEIAAINSPESCVLAGPEKEIFAVDRELQEKGVKGLHILKTSHAFHSRMMEPAMEEFHREVSLLDLAAPNIPYISNVTGGWITKEQATDPGYWVQHLREAVKFSDGVQTLAKTVGGVFLEVGPGQALTSMVKENLGTKSFSVISTVRHVDHKQADDEFLIRAIGKLWLSGVKVDWGKIRHAKDVRKVHLPTYPLQPMRYWIDNVFTSEAEVSRDNGLIDKVEESAHYHDRPSLSEEFKEPTTPLEKQVVDLWRHSFEIEKIGVDDNFFELGGSSLQALLLIDLLAEKLGVELTLSHLFDHPTVSSLCVHLAEKSSELNKLTSHKGNDVSSAFGKIKPDLENRYKPFPLNDIQHAYWLGRSGAFSLGDNATHIYLEIEIKQGDVADFNAAWNKLIRRHDMLRSVVLPSGEQAILESVPEYQFDVHNIVGRDPDEIDKVQQEVRETMSHNVIDLEQWPLFEIGAIKSKPEGFRLCISIDILIADAWSINLLIEQWLMLYQSPDFQLPPLTLSFRDYVLAEQEMRNSGAYSRSREYWINRMDSLPASPDLPLAQAPDKVEDPSFKRRTHTLSAEKWKILKEKATALGVTPSVCLMTVFSEVLALWSRSPHFTINLTLYNRNPVHSEVNEIVGDFTSLTLLEIDNTASKSIADRIKILQKQLWSDLDNRFFGAISVLREMSRRQGSQVSVPIVFTSTLGVRSLKHEADKSNSIGEEGYGISQTTQVWLDHQVMEWNGTLRFNWDTVESLFPEGMVDAMFLSYCRILDALTKDSALWESDIASRLLPDDQARRLEAINETRRPLDKDMLQVLFEKQVQKQPDQLAVVSFGRNLTYKRLYEESIGLAVRLREYGCQPNELVGVVMDKCVEQIVSVMGVLFAGSAYLPIDPDIPSERMHYILENSNVKLILTLSSIVDEIDVPTQCNHICVDQLSEPSADTPSLKPAQTFDDLAYVIYTSGSTGMPKGVMIPHRGAVNTVIDINRRFSVGEKDRIIALSALNFDLSVYDIFGSLSSGATLVMPEAGNARNPEHWVSLIREFKVTFWNTVPALMQMLVDYIEDSPNESFEELRVAMMSGDWIPPKLPERMMDLWPTLKVVSAGGPTECSIWSASHPVVREDCQLDSIPYGKPLDNQQIRILNKSMQTCPYWVPGELYIAGEGLAQGYLNDENKTNAAFIRHPLTHQKLYKSGDLGRYLPDGNIEFLGRDDFQVNINGHRVELGEIESALNEQVGIKDSVVVAMGNKQNKNKSRLIAYVVQDQELANIATDKAEVTNFKLSQPGLRSTQSSDKIVPLPKPNIDKTAFVRRQSYRRFIQEPIELDKFNSFISSLVQLQLDGEPLPKHLYPSAGSLHAVRVYLQVKNERISGLEGGTYYYHPAEHVLVKINKEGAINRNQFGVGENPYIYDDAAFALFLVADTNVIAKIYGMEKAREFAFLEAGYMGQILLEKAPAKDIGLCPLGYVSDGVRSALSIDEGQLVVHSLVGGRIEPAQIEVWTQAGPDSLKARDNSSGSEGSNDELMNILREKLPAYMLPSSIVYLKELPLTANGKVDRKSLASMEIAEEEIKVHVSPKSNTEEKLASIWMECLGIDKVSVNDSFFELGGDSVLIIKAQKKICERFRKDISVVDIFRYTTISSLAKFIDSDSNQVVGKTADSDRVKKQKSALMHQRKRMG